MNKRSERRRPGATTLIAAPESMVPTASPTPPPETPPKQTASGRESAERIKRNVQLTPALAKEYDDKVFELHARYRAKKNRIHDAFMQVALAHLDEVEDLLRS